MFYPEHYICTCDPLSFRYHEAELDLELDKLPYETFAVVSGQGSQEREVASLKAMVMLLPEEDGNSFQQVLDQYEDTIELMSTKNKFVVRARGNCHVLDMVQQRAHHASFGRARIGLAGPNLCTACAESARHKEERHLYLRRDALAPPS